MIFRPDSVRNKFIVALVCVDVFIFVLYRQSIFVAVISIVLRPQGSIAVFDVFVFIRTKQ